MVISRKDAVDRIVDLLQPASLSPNELRQKVEAEIEFKAQADQAFDLEETHHTQHGRTTHASQKQGESFVKAANAFLNSLERLGPEYRMLIDAHFMHFKSNSMRELVGEINKIKHIVDAHRATYRPKRSGGATQARTDKARKDSCAIFALSLLRLHHDRKISPEYRKYLEITSVLTEHFEGIADADVRRSCADMFNLLYAHEQDDL